MKKFIIVCILLGFILSVIFIFLFYKPDVSSTNKSNLFEEMTFINESIPIQNKNLLCRMNIRNYLENLDLDLIECVSHINLNERVKHGFKKPTILFIIDHEFKSSDKSAKNYFNFLDNENLILCISEDWLDKAHPKLQLWPIGLESKMILKNYLVKILLEKMSTPIQGKGIMSNAHFKTYKHPASSYRDDRNDMVRALKNENIVDFWNQRQSQADTLQLTQNYAYNLCPEGNGLDTHRFYETFALGVHPVIRRGPLTKLHMHFETTKVVEQWKDVTRLQKERPLLNIKMEKLTIGYWLYKCLRSRCKIVTFFTGNLCEEWRNLVFTLRNVNLFDLLVVFPLDDVALQCCKNEGAEFRTDLVLNNLPGEASFGEGNWGNIMKVKLEAIKIILQENYFVLYVDTDIVFFQDPFVHIFNLHPKDIYFQSDGRGFNVSKNPNLCAGFMFLIPNEKCIKLMDQSLNIIEQSNHRLYDQDVINRIVKKNKIKNLDYGILSPSLFPNGARFFGQKKKCAENPFIVHNNYIVGLEAKVKRFKKHGLWYVSDSDPDILS